MEYSKKYYVVNIVILCGQIGNHTIIYKCIKVTHSTRRKKSMMFTVDFQ